MVETRVVTTGETMGGYRGNLRHSHLIAYAMTGRREGRAIILS